MSKKCVGGRRGRLSLDFGSSDSGVMVTVTWNVEKFQGAGGGAAGVGDARGWGRKS